MKHTGAGSTRVHLRHLLGHLIRRLREDGECQYYYLYTGTEKWKKIAELKRSLTHYNVEIGERKELTIVIAEDKNEDRLEPEEVEEVPGKGRHPPDVKIARRHAGLKHGLESNGKGKG